MLYTIFLSSSVSGLLIVFSPSCSVFCILHNALYLFCCLISGLSTLSSAPLFLFSAIVLFCLRFVGILFYLRLFCSVSGLSIVLSYFLLCFRSPYCSLIFTVMFPISLLCFSSFLFCFWYSYCSHHLSTSVSGFPIVLSYFLFCFRSPFSSSALFCFRSPHFQGFIIIIWMLSSSVPWQNWYHWSWPSPAGVWWRRLASRTGSVWWPPCPKLEWYTHETSGFKTLEWLQIFSWNFCSCFKPSRC